MTSNTDLINKLSGIQAQVWGTVSQIVSEACGQLISFGDPLTVATTPGELANELMTPMLAISFSFSNFPEKSQAILIPQDSLVGLATVLRGEEVEEVDENLVVDLRPQLESVVQGLCLAAGNLIDEPVVATAISIRFQLFQLPQSMVRADLLVRSQVAVSAKDFTGVAIWLLDGENAMFLCGEEAAEEEQAAFLQLETGGPGAAAQAAGNEEFHALGILYDIPLEVSVELGRVKMVVRDVLELGAGSIVEIDKAAGEPVDVMVNGRLVARGEVVVIDDNFGVRVTEICSAADRLSKLGEAA